jgi:membrane protein YqaA with SNARE-associated domain
VLATILSVAQKAARTARRGQSGGYTSILRHLGATGLFLLAILDSSPLPTFGGPDILTAILAARHGEPWYYYALMATTGSVIGAYVTFRMARGAGAGYLHRKFGERRVAGLLRFFDRWGTGALVVTTAVPFPFPTSAFFAAAGVVGYPVRTYLMVVTIARAVRYSGIALIASHYGRHFIRVLRHPDRYMGWLALAAGIVIAVTAATILLTRKIDTTAGETVRTP